MINKERLRVANKVLAILGEDYLKAEFIVDTRNRLCLTWTNHRGRRYSPPWVTRGGSSYPSWSGKLACGGTMMTAIAQLALWVRGLPCYLIQTWEHWCGETVGMKGGEQIIPLLKNSDYPDEVKCAFCGATDTKLDWYWFSRHPKHSGFGCLLECKEIKEVRSTVAKKKR